MKLTIEKDPERIKRFSHIRPAPRRGSVLCAAKCPGTLRTCTLQRSHSGPHVAHGAFKRVVAVWDAAASERVVQRTGRGPAKAPRPGGGPEAGPIALLVKHVVQMVRRVSVEEVVFLILAISMVGFAVDWALRILGLK